MGDRSRSDHTREPAAEAGDARTLRFTTGVARADAALRMVVARFEAAFPGRAQGYYVTGSYATGDALPTSDLDVTVVMRGALDVGARAAADWLAARCAADAPIELDIAVDDEASLLADGAHPSFTLGSQLVYSADGDDVRPRTPLPLLAEWTRDRMSTSYWRLVNLFGRLPVVRYPLAYPDADDEFYGYLRRPLRLPDGSEVVCTRDLIRATGWAATALLAWRAGVYVGSKRDCHLLYRQHIGDEWADLLTDIYECCARRWRYLIPAASEERARLRSICDATLGFENHFLLACREYLLTELRSGDPERQRAATHTLALLPYADDEIAAAMQATVNTSAT
ncbi:MAG TPA: nucleotidyltransferase domain-containing protein [Ktedonobacterales bacterium]|nr:nucleotidyltransferase domain-containing protein [Ktedonobacterales bacterium]